MADVPDESEHASLKWAVRRWPWPWADLRPASGANDRVRRYADEPADNAEDEGEPCLLGADCRRLRTGPAAASASRPSPAGARGGLRFCLSGGWAGDDGAGDGRDSACCDGSDIGGGWTPQRIEPTRAVRRMQIRAWLFA